MSQPPAYDPDLAAPGAREAGRALYPTRLMALAFALIVVAGASWFLVMQSMRHPEVAPITLQTTELTIQPSQR